MEKSAFTGPIPFASLRANGMGGASAAPHLHQPFIRKAVIAAATDYHVVHQSDVK